MAELRDRAADGERRSQLAREYGIITTSTGSVANPLLYAGQYLDSESGLYYLRARYYDPVTAQFLTVDPMVAQTQSPYGYALGDPVNASDPTGMYLTGSITQQRAFHTAPCKVSSFGPESDAALNPGVPCVNYQGQTVTVPASEAWGGSECMFTPSEWSSIQAESGGGNNPNAYNQTYTQPNMSGSGSVNSQGNAMQLNSGLGTFENRMACEVVWSAVSFEAVEVAIEAAGITSTSLHFALSGSGILISATKMDPCGE